MRLYDSELESYHNSVYFSGESLSVNATHFYGDNRVTSKVHKLNQRSNGGGLFVRRVLIMRIQHCNFTDLVGENGGGLYYMEDVNAKNAMDQALGFKTFYSIVMIDNKFVNCEAITDGGAMYLSDVSNIEFLKGYVEGVATNKGGGIYFYCTETDSSGNNIVPCDMMID